MINVIVHTLIIKQAKEALLCNPFWVGGEIGEKRGHLDWESLVSTYESSAPRQKGEQRLQPSEKPSEGYQTHGWVDKTLGSVVSLFGALFASFHVN